MGKFKGIKFASAERFGHPVPMPDLETIDGLDCENTICPQPISGLSRFYGLQTEYEEQSEDCLRLTIYTPDTSASLPVLIWIHGGSYMTGSGQYVRYDASDFAQSEQIVVVNISYRLGMLGFMGGDNLALEDQKCAMEWVRRNIHLFGGDYSRTTVMGQSAGAHSLLCHIADSESRLFSKAILMSAPFISKTKRSMKRLTEKFLKALPCTASEADMQQILRAQSIATRTILPSMPIAPVCSGLTNPENIAPGLKKVILMYQRDDAAVFSPSKYLTRAITKVVFESPAKRLARNLRKRGIDTQVVERTWGHDTTRFGAIHFMEIPLLFGDWELWKKGSFLDGISDSEYAAESERFRKFIGDFVKS